MKKVISFFSVLFVTVVFGQATQTENYVETRVYLDPVTSTNTSARQVHTVQYFDGLGRPKQVVNVKASPTGKDVVTHIEYDQFGKQVKDYLPVPQAGTQNGQIYGSPLGNASTIYGSEKIYAEKILEASPLDRVLSQTQVGTDWQTHPVEFGYFANEANEVKKYVTTTTWTNNATVSVLKIDPSNSFYPANQLYKNKVTDEDDNVSYEFKNGQGQTLLVRKMLSATESADTYYVYNEYDQLAFVISPLASNIFKNLGVGTNISTTKLNDLNNLCYQYKYDGRNRLVEKKLPGKGWEWMVYDKQDRLVATKDSQNPWLFTKYDQFGRVVYTGLANLGTNRNTVQTNANNQGGNESRSSSTFNHSNMQIYYTNNVFPNGNFNKILSINYYDTYPTGSPAIPTTIINATQPTLGQNAQSSPISTKSLPTASYVKNIEDDNWTKTYSWYDQRGRVIGTHSINHLGGFTKTESLLDFAGAVQESNTYHSRASTSTEVTIHEEFEYDHQNRLTQHRHQVDSNPMIVLAENSYNELSQLTNKSIGKNVEQTDYTYNIRGWMTGINPSYIDNIDDRKFSYVIKYNEENSNTFSQRYNGNIAEIEWINAGGAQIKKRYSYNYDQLNRLTDAYFSHPGLTTPLNHANDELLTYDLNGNISTLKRNAFQTFGGNVETIDDLEYHYSGNRITSINDNANNPTGYEGGNGEIHYDSNGNMVVMMDKSIQGVIYNHLNLPNTIGLENLKKNLYLYRADGVKLRKIFSVPDGAQGVFSSYTDYLDGFHYLQTEGIVNNNEDPYGYAYEQEAFINLIFESEVNPKLKFFPTAEGFFDYENNEYIYQYKDHLGNVRVSYNQYGEITDQNDYYPFGMNIPREEESIVGTASLYNYKYQGQELQETGFYMFKYRTYMPDTGRFMQLDPLAEKFPYNSTYAIQENKMGMGIELEGLELLPHHSGYFAISGNQMTVKQAPITQRDSFGRPTFRAGDIGLSTSGYNPNGARISTGTTGLRLNEYKYNGPTPSGAKMESIRGDDRPTNTWTKIYDKGVDKASKISSGVKELYKTIELALNIPDAIKSTSNYVQATKDVNSVLDQGGVMGDAINYVDSSGIKMGTQLRNDVVNYVFDGTLPAGTDTQNRLIIQNGTSILNSNNLPIRPTSGQVKSMMENKQREIQNKLDQIPH